MRIFAGVRWAVAHTLLMLALPAFSYPTDQPVPNVFSVRVLNSFHLYRSTDPGEIYYVPKQGGIRLDGDLSAPYASFSADFLVGTEMPFYGKRLLSFGGTYSTLGLIGNFQQLLDEASDSGYRITPFPTAKATNYVMLRGNKKLREGFQLSCQEIQVPLPVYDELGNPVLDPNGVQSTQLTAVPHCKMPHPEKPGETIPTSAVIEYHELSVHSSDIEADIPFQGTFHPAQTPGITQKLRTGSRWDALIKSRVEWSGSVLQTPFYAELEVNWKSLTDILWVKAAIHNNACVDVQVDAMIGEIVTCNNKERCGVRIRWFNSDGTPTANDGLQPPPVMADFGRQVAMVRKEIQDQLFDYVQLPPEPGDPEESGAIFTVRANYRKLTVERHETIPVFYFPDPRVMEAGTDMTVGCVKGTPGGFFDFAIEVPACRGILERSNLPQER